MHSIEHYGYGYSKKLCDDVSFWFLNTFFPRHKINVEIIHRGLKRENVFGWCDVIGGIYRPRNFVIEIQSHMDKDIYIQTLMHEFTHVSQWVNKTLYEYKGKMYYKSCKIEDYDYEDQPHEIEAREQEEILYSDYLKQSKLYGKLLKTTGG